MTGSFGTPVCTSLPKTDMFEAHQLADLLYKLAQE